MSFRIFFLATVILLGFVLVNITPLQEASATVNDRNSGLVTLTGSVGIISNWCCPESGLTTGDTFTIYVAWDDPHEHEYVEPTYDYAPNTHPDSDSDPNVGLYVNYASLAGNIGVSALDTDSCNLRVMNDVYEIDEFRIECDGVKINGRTVNDFQIRWVDNTGQIFDSERVPPKTILSSTTWHTEINAYGDHYSIIVGSIDSISGTGTTTTQSNTVNSDVTTTTDSAGTTTTKYPDGTTVVKYTNGNTDTTYPDGKRVIDFAAGHQDIYFSDGTYTRIIDGIKYTTNPDETIVTEYPDGTITTEYPDGTKTTTNADGTAAISGASSGVTDDIDAAIGMAGGYASIAKTLDETNASISVTLGGPGGDDPLLPLGHVQFSGEGTPGDKVTVDVYDDHGNRVFTETVSVESDGEWNSLTKLDGGSYTVSYRGDTDAKHTIFDLPYLSSDAVTVNALIGGKGDPLLSIDDVRFSGIGTPGDKVTVDVYDLEDNRVFTETVSVDSDGDWDSQSITLDGGDYVAFVKTDGYVLDRDGFTIAGDPHSIFEIDDALNVSLGGEKTLLSLGQVSFDGTGTPGSEIIIEVYDELDDLVFSEIVFVESDGNWYSSITHLDGGDYTIFAGVEGQSSESADFTMLESPSYDVTLDVNIGGGKNLLSLGQAEFTGTGMPGDIVAIEVYDSFDDLVFSEFVTVESDGDWYSANIDLDGGDYTVFAGISGESSTFSEFTIKESLIPEYQKKVLGWGAEGLVSDVELMNNMIWLFANGIVSSPDIKILDNSEVKSVTNSPNSETVIPEYQKKVLGWGAEGLVSDVELMNNMIWLFANGIASSPNIVIEKPVSFGTSTISDVPSVAYGIDSKPGLGDCTSTTECDAALTEHCGSLSYGECILTWFGTSHAWSDVHSSVIVDSDNKYLCPEGICEINKEVAESTYQIQMWNVAIFTQLLELKNFESRILNDASDDKWNEYAEDKNQHTMNQATSLERESQLAIESVNQALKSLNYAIAAADLAKSVAVTKGIPVLELEDSVQEQQEIIDSVLPELANYADFRHAIYDLDKLHYLTDAEIDQLIINSKNYWNRVMDRSSVDGHLFMNGLLVRMVFGDESLSDFEKFYTDLGTFPLDTVLTIDEIKDLEDARRYANEDESVVSELAPIISLGAPDIIKGHIMINEESESIKNNSHPLSDVLP